jgi:hypothetical protein
VLGDARASEVCIVRVGLAEGAMRVRDRDGAGLQRFARMPGKERRRCSVQGGTSCRSRLRVGSMRGGEEALFVLL